MFDIAWSELALIGAVALVVIGPKDLPKVMRTMGQWTRKARLLAGEFQSSVDEMVRQAELEELRKKVQSVNPAVNSIGSMVESSVREAIDGVKPASPAPVSAPTLPEVPVRAETPLPWAPDAGTPAAEPVPVPVPAAAPGKADPDKEARP